MLEDLLSAYRLLIMVGAGGVGKTTTSARWAVKAALVGKRVAVLTIDPARRLADVLGLPLWRGEYVMTPEDWARMGLSPKGSLTAMMFDPRDEAEAVVYRSSPNLQQAKALIENRFYHVFSTSLAGSQEFLAVLGVAHLCKDERFDLVLLDTAPASRAMEFFDTPDRIFRALQNPWLQSFLNHAPVTESLRARLKNRGKSMVLRALERMTGEGFLEDLSRFLALFADVMGQARQSCADLQKLLRAPGTGFVAVTSLEEGPLEDALQLRCDLMQRQMHFAGIACHQPLAPIERPSSEALRARLCKEGDPGGERLLQRLIDWGDAYQKRALRDQRALARLAALGDVPCFVLDAIQK